jgi:signal transduction histidine kinase
MSLELTVLSVVVAANLFLGLLVFIRDSHGKINRSFAFLSLGIAFWSISLYLSDHSSNQNLALLWNRLVFAVAFLQGGTLVYFALVFPTKASYLQWFRKWIIYPLSFALAGISTFTGLIVSKIEFVSWGTDIKFGSLYLVFIIFMLFATLGTFLILFLRIRGSKGLEKIQIKYIFYGLLLAGIIAITTNLVIPLFIQSTVTGKFGPYSMILLVGFTAYAILKHHLFSIRVIVTEIGAVIVNLVLLIQLFLSKSFGEGVVRGIFFLIVLYGSYILVQSVIKEIEHRKELQKLTKQLEDANKHLKELDQMKTEFISIASHELLTPISAILGYLSMILDEKLVPVDNPKTKKFLDNVYSSAKRLSKLVEDLLNVSRIEQGRIVVDRQAIDVAKAAKEVIAETMPKAKERKLTLEFEEPRETIPKVYADFDKVKEILVNIVGNAIKFTQKGGVTISLSTSRDPDVQGKRGPGNYVIISVKDTGVGIPKEEQENIFKKFSRAGRWATRDVQGTGLGLYVSKSLIEMLGGKIWVESAAGKGSTFSISLSEVHPDDKREISGDVAKLGQPEQKQAVDKGEVKHTKLKPEQNPDDTSRRMREVLKDLTKEEKQKIRDIQIDKE